MSIEMPHTALEDQPTNQPGDIMPNSLSHDFLKEILTKHTSLVEEEFESDLDLEFFSFPDCLTLQGQTIRDFDFRGFKLSGAHFLNCQFDNCLFDNRDIYELLMHCCLFTNCQTDFTCSSACLYGNTHRQGTFYLSGSAEINHLTGIGSKIVLDVKDSTLCNIDIDEGSLVLSLTQSSLFNLKHRNLRRFHVDLDAESLFM